MRLARAARVVHSICLSGERLLLKEQLLNLFIKTAVLNLVRSKILTRFKDLKIGLKCSNKIEK